MDELIKTKQGRTAIKVFKKLQNVLKDKSVDDDTAGMAVCMLFGKFLEAAYESNKNDAKNVDELVNAIREQAMNEVGAKSDSRVGVAYR